jgi:hypothetical protein
MAGRTPDTTDTAGTLGLSLGLFRVNLGRLRGLWATATRLRHPSAGVEAKVFDADFEEARLC